jgi:rhodanese-related sulfurtransferase
MWPRIIPHLSVTLKAIVVFTTSFILASFASERISFALRDASAKPVAVTFIDAAQLMTWIKTGRAFQLVDARPDSLYDDGHIAEATSIRRGSAYDSLGREPIVVYCDHSPVSKLDPCFRAVVSVLQNGLHEVYWLKGGIAAWRSAGFGLEKSETENLS